MLLSSHPTSAESTSRDVRLFWPAAVLMVALGVFAIGVGNLLDGCSGDAFCDAREGLAIGRMVALSSGLVFGVALVVLGLRARGRPVDRRHLACAAVCSVAAGLAASTPVSVGWDDGCNYHGALVPLVLYPAVWSEPEGFPGAYADIQTLMLCIDRP